VAVCQSIVKLLVLYGAKIVGLFSGCRRVGAEKCALLGYYAASGGNFLPTFRDNLSVSSPGLGIISYRRSGTTYRCQLQDELFLTDVSGQPIGVIFRTLELFLTDVSGQPIGVIFRTRELFLTDVSRQPVGAVLRT